MVRRATGWGLVENSLGGLTRLYRAIDHDPATLEDFRSMAEEGQMPRGPTRPAKERSFREGVSAWTTLERASALARGLGKRYVAPLDVAVLLAHGIEVTPPSRAGHSDLFGDRDAMIAAVVDGIVPVEEI